MTRWPVLVNHDQPWPLMDSVVVCMLVAMSLLAFVGIRYPVQMLPAPAAVRDRLEAAPARRRGAAAVDRRRMDPATWETTFACLLVVIYLVVIPWRYVFTHYVTKHGERWRRVLARPTPALPPGGFR